MIPSEIKSLDELGLPAQLPEACCGGSLTVWLRECTDPAATSS